MRSLSAHLRQAGEHGGLPFHPDCPICREERLSGILATNGVISPRTKAVIAASLLALPTAGPAAALAAEPDQQQDGTAAPAQTGSPDSAQNPDFDPGGDSTDLPADAPAVPQTQAPPDPGNDDSAPLDGEPGKDTSDPVVDNADGSDTASDQQQPAAPNGPAPPTASGATQPAAPAGPAPSTPAPASTDAPAPPTAGSPAASDVTPKSTARDQARHRRPGPALRGTSAGIADQAPSPGGATEAVQAPAAPSPPVRAGHHAKPGDGTHIVERGESLWSIASDVLGDSASPARVAREVHRLWQLNRERIGTGDPDLLMIGTRLKLR